MYDGREYPWEAMTRDPLGNTLRIVVTASWVLVVASLVIVATASRTIGKPAWWVTELSFPVGPLLVAVPFVAPVAAVLATWRAPRVATLVQMLGVALLGAVAALDVVRTPAVAIAQFVVAGCALLVSIGSLAARPVRRSTTPPAPTSVRDLTDTGARP